MVRAGLHCSLRISRQMLPLLLMLGWKTLVLNATWRGKKRNKIALQKTHTIKQSKASLCNHIQTRLKIGNCTIDCKTNYLRGLERIIRRKMDSNQKYPSCIWTISRSHYCCLPVKHIFSYRAYIPEKKNYQPQIWVIPHETDHSIQNKNASKVGSKPWPSTVMLTERSWNLA